MVDVATACTMVLSACTDQLMSTPGGKPARVGMVPAAIAWDECDTCGLLALSVNRFFLSDQFPIEATTADKCEGSVLAADLVMQIIRCVPQPGDGGRDLAPTVDALNSSAISSIADAEAVMCATVETMRDLYLSNEIVEYMVRQQIFVGPEGACVGSELQFIIGFQR